MCIGSIIKLTSYKIYLKLPTDAAEIFCFLTLDAIVKEIVEFKLSVRGKGGLGIKDNMALARNR